METYVLTKDYKIGKFINEEVGFAFHTHDFYYEYKQVPNDAILKSSNDIVDLFDGQFAEIVNKDTNHCVTWFGYYTNKLTKDDIIRLSDAHQELYLYGAVYTYGEDVEPIIRSVAKSGRILSSGEMEWELL